MFLDNDLSELRNYESYLRCDIVKLACQVTIDAAAGVNELISRLNSDDKRNETLQSITDFYFDNINGAMTEHVYVK